jgi:hypothetical protein
MTSFDASSRNLMDDEQLVNHCHILRYCYHPRMLRNMHWRSQNEESLVKRSHLWIRLEDRRAVSGDDQTRSLSFAEHPEVCSLNLPAYQRMRVETEFRESSPSYSPSNGQIKALRSTSFVNNVLDIVGLYCHINFVLTSLTMLYKSSEALLLTRRCGVCPQQTQMLHMIVITRYFS